MSSVPVQVFTLSRFRVLRGGVPLESSAKAQRKPLELLKLLIALGGEQVPAGQIADALWPDSDGEAAHQSFASALHRLRKLIGTETLSLRDNCLTIVGAYCEVDAFMFEAALGESERALARSDPDGLTLSSERALELYRGPFLEGEFAPSELLVARSRLHSRFLRHVGKVARWYETSGLPDRATVLLRRGLEADGASEELAQHLMRLLAARGRSADALAVHQRLSEVLRASAGASLSPESEALRRSIEASANTRRDPALSKEEPALSAATLFANVKNLPEQADRPVGPREPPFKFLRFRLAIASAALFAVILIVGVAMAFWSILAEGDSAAGLVKRPSIAVLPFANLSGDPEQEFFADGITDDIITDLSGVRGMLVIARESTFQYKGQPLDIRQVGRELNVRYVLEGSVRRADGHVRISAQLIDASNGAHIWADRFDRSIADIFAVQDEITSKIVEELEVSLVEGEQNRILRISTMSPEAYDLALRGRNLFLSVSRENNALAARLLERALQLDSNYIGAMVFLGWAHFQDAQWGWEDVRPVDESLALMEDLAGRILRTDPQSADAQSMLGGIALLRGRHEIAIQHGERAAALNPNSAKTQALLGWMLYTGGRAKDGLRRMKSAMRLNPIPPAWMWSCMAEAQLALGDYESALEPAGQAIASAPEFVEPRMFRLVALVRMRRLAEARTEGRKILEIDPTFDPVRFVRNGYKYQDPSIPEDWIEAFRQVGLD